VRAGAPVTTVAPCTVPHRRSATVPVPERHSVPFFLALWCSAMRGTHSGASASDTAGASDAPPAVCAAAADDSDTDAASSPPPSERLIHKYRVRRPLILAEAAAVPAPTPVPLASMAMTATVSDSHGAIGPSLHWRLQLVREPARMACTAQFARSLLPPSPTCMQLAWPEADSPSAAAIQWDALYYDQRVPSSDGHCPLGGVPLLIVLLNESHYCSGRRLRTAEHLSMIAAAVERDGFDLSLRAFGGQSLLHAAALAVGDPLNDAHVDFAGHVLRIVVRRCSTEQLTELVAARDAAGCTPLHSLLKGRASHARSLPPSWQRPLEAWRLLCEAGADPLDRAPQQFGPPLSALQLLVQGGEAELLVRVLADPACTPDALLRRLPLRAGDETSLLLPIEQQSPEALPLPEQLCAGLLRTLRAWQLQQVAEGPTQLELFGAAPVSTPVPGAPAPSRDAASAVHGLCAATVPVPLDLRRWLCEQVTVCDTHLEAGHLARDLSIPLRGAVQVGQQECEARAAAAFTALLRLLASPDTPAPSLLYNNNGYTRSLLAALAELDDARWAVLERDDTACAGLWRLLRQLSATQLSERATRHPSVKVAPLLTTWLRFAPPLRLGDLRWRLLRHWIDAELTRDDGTVVHARTLARPMADTLLCIARVQPPVVSLESEAAASSAEPGADMLWSRNGPVPSLASARLAFELLLECGVLETMHNGSGCAAEAAMLESGNDALLDYWLTLTLSTPEGWWLQQAASGPPRPELASLTRKQRHSALQHARARLQAALSQWRIYFFPQLRAELLAHSSLSQDTAGLVLAYLALDQLAPAATSSAAPAHA